MWIAAIVSKHLLNAAMYMVNRSIHTPVVLHLPFIFNLQSSIKNQLCFSFSFSPSLSLWFSYLGNDVAWHPDGSLIAIGLSNSQIKIFDRRAAKLIQLYNVHLEAVNSIAFHPSGNIMITGSDDGSTKVLDLLEGRPIYTLVGHDDAVTAVAFSSDGNDFATASKDKQVS